MLWAEFSSMSKSWGNLLLLSPACHLSGIKTSWSQEGEQSRSHIRAFIHPSIYQASLEHLCFLSGWYL